MSRGKTPAKRVSRSAVGASSALQFRISEVSSLLGISPSALRQWENAGLTRPGRTQGGYRTYTFEQVNVLKHIHQLRTEKGLNIEAIRHLLGKPEKPRSESNKGAQGTSDLGIGRRLRRLRQDKQLTLAEACDATGLSPSFLSCLERGQVHASVSTLQKLSVFYNSSVLSFFDDGKKGKTVSKLVRPAQRKKLSNEPGIDIELLATGKIAMEIHIFKLAPGSHSGGSYHHEGEEFIFMLGGVCDIWLDEVEHHLLREGDCLYFSSMQTHRWSNPGKSNATLLWVNTPPTF
jgi:DNA-binding transcriptional MerR regulator/quercetin dioxygenase-like cupin family protein